MKTLRAMQASQIKKFAGFLEAHPGFSPELKGENADVHGFRVGKCLLSVDEMERLIGMPVGAGLAARLHPAANHKQERPAVRRHEVLR